MRMRKKKWADPYMEAHGEYVLAHPEENKGKWHEVLNADKLHVEIGTGKGDYLINMSESFKEDGWVGIEKDHNVAAIACKKAIEDENIDISNKRMIVLDADDLLEWFAPNEIDVIHLNFSDPWPKTRTHKRRLSSKKFLEMYKVVLSDGGYIRMKTDNKDLFEDSVLYFLENGFTLFEFSVDYRRHDHDEDAITEYERRFMDLGQPIYQLCAIPCSDKEDVLK